MNWSSMEKRVVLLACALAIAGSCCIAACDATPAGNQARATPEGDEAAVDTRDERRRTDAQEVLAYLQGADFRMGDARLGAAFDVGAEEAACRDELEVRVSEGGVWVLETCRESAEERTKAEEEIVSALVCGLSAPAGECGPLVLPWLKATDAVGLKVMEATNGKLTEVRACVLACSLAGAVLESDDADNGEEAESDSRSDGAKNDSAPNTAYSDGAANTAHGDGEDGGGNAGGDADTDDNPKNDADQESNDASNTTGTGHAWPEVPEGALVVHVPKTPATAEVTWVVVKEGDAGEAADDSNASKASEMDKADKNGAEVSGAGAGKPSGDPSAGEATPGANPDAGASNGNGSTDGNAPANPQPSGPSNPGSVDVTERPSGSQPGSGSGSVTGTTPSPQPEEPKRTWVVDKPAWDERVMTSQAWDEQVWVSKQEWVTNNVWVVDQAAWDEQVLVREGYYETVRTTSRYRFAADDYITYDEADLAEHTKYLMSQGLPTNYYVEWEHEQVWHEPEYTTVHHDEQGHWEDRGSYQEKGYYQTIHHEAEYTIVHHEEEGHWE